MTGRSVADRLVQVQGRIDAAAERAGRRGSDVRLIAVTKGVDAPRVREALGAGATDLGENRVQEAHAKREAIGDVGGGVTWHLLGHLQRNKAKAAAELFDAVHSIDSVVIATALAEHRAPARDPLTALLQVNFTDLDTRSGVNPSDAPAVVRGLRGLTGIALVGLMTIPPPGGPDTSRPYFVRLRQLRDVAERETGVALPELSMGMSDDFEVAVEEGATMVRVGRAIFGARQS